MYMCICVELAIIIIITWLLHWAAAFSASTRRLFLSGELTRGYIVSI